jgi:DNA-binding IclR family transcriptional regulator
VQVAVLDGREVVYVERRESPQAIRLFGRVGHRNDAYCTSTGKVLLAHLPVERLELMLDGWELRPHTPFTITDIERLREQLDIVRKRGWADQVNETEMGAASIAAPIRNGLGEVVAALSVAGPSQRLQGDSLKRFARPMVDAAQAISRRMGFRDAVPRDPSATPR